VIGIHVKWGINSLLSNRANLLEKIMASIPPLLKEFEGTSSLFFLSTQCGKVWPSCIEIVTRGSKSGDVDTCCEKGLNSKTSYSMREFLTIALLYFIFKNMIPYLQKGFIITWVYSKTIWGNTSPPITSTPVSNLLGCSYLVLVPCKWVGKGTTNVEQFLYWE
jgi:hypothetical protein